MSTQLPTDVFRLVFGHLEAGDIQVVRRVCKDFYDLSNLRSVWNALVHKHLVQKNIPVPGLYERPLELISAKELESCFYRALNLRRNWTSESPIVRSRITLTAIPKSRIVSVQFLPGNGPRRLLSLSMTMGQHRTFILQCWDLEGLSPTCIASKELLRFRGAAINKMESTSGMIAVLNPHLEILSLDMEASQPELRLLTSVTMPEEVHGLHAFSGTSLVTRDGRGCLYAWDINRPQVKVELKNPALNQPTTLIDVIMTRGFILILRQTTLEMYALPFPIPAFANSVIFQPVYVFDFRWRIDNGVMTIRRRPRPKAFDDVYIVLRYGSYYPWSLNLLHHYEIRLNPFFFEDRPISPANLPYSFPPVLQDTIASPVRLHSTSDLAIGPYGTAIWTDTHTEDYFNHADRGQRLAGRFVPYIADVESGEVELSDQHATATAESVYAYQEEDSWVRVALDETEGTLALGRQDGVISVLKFV